MTTPHLLVPTDFSPYADQALTEAIELAHALNAQLTLLHVMQLMPLTVGDVPPQYFDDYLEEVEAEAQRQMQAPLNRVYQAGLQGDSVITQGIPFQTIVDMAGGPDYRGHPRPNRPLSCPHWQRGGKSRAPGPLPGFGGAAEACGADGLIADAPETTR
jgi:hypothetical protein